MGSHRHTIASILGSCALPGCSSHSALTSSIPTSHDAMPEVVQTGQPPVNFVRFPIYTANQAIIKGADGATWFDCGCSPNLFRVDNAGNVTSISPPMSYYPNSM